MKNFLEIPRVDSFRAGALQAIVWNQGDNMI